jgi:hypothetical protein
MNGRARAIVIVTYTVVALAVGFVVGISVGVCWGVWVCD